MEALWKRKCCIASAFVTILLSFNLDTKKKKEQKIRGKKGSKLHQFNHLQVSYFN